MRRLATLLLPTAALVFVVAWLTPVIDQGTTLGQGGVPGWEAFRVALSPVWPYEGFEAMNWFWSIIAVSSALTNFLFVAALAHLVWQPGVYRRAVCWALALAFVVDSAWFVFSGDREYLRLGYYLWVASFALLAVAAWLPTARADRAAMPGATSGDRV
ncbi:MAG: hypothetical protein OER21_11140 [Gemmatimonadota bacterium]|nr:hypothetical protein [Gemmatimonadota bacterium]